MRAAWILPAAFVLAFALVPLIALAMAVGSAAFDTRSISVAGGAALQALASTLLALLVGIPATAAVARFRFTGQPIAQALVTVPFVLPTVVVALAIRSLLARSPLADDAPTGILVVIAAHAFVNIAVIVRIVGAQWRSIDPRQAVVARTLGAGPTRAFLTVTVPALAPSVALASGIVFVYSFSSLGLVLLLGGGTVRTLETQIVRQSSVLLDFPAAAATSMIQAVVVVLVLLAASRIGRTRGRDRVRPLQPLPAAWRGALVRAGALLACLLVLAPVVALVLASLPWWGSLSVDPGTTRIGSPLIALARSLGYAAATALVAAVIGGCAAVAMLGGRLGRMIGLLAVIPLGISSATLGLGTLLAYGRGPVDLRGTGLLIPLAHALVAVPLVIAIAAPAMQRTDIRAYAVAQTLGAGPSRAFWTAYGPVLRIVCAGGAALAGAVSLGELGAASLLARAGEPTVPLQIARLLSRPGEASIGVAAVLAVVLVVLVLAVVLVVDRAGDDRRSAPISGPVRA